MDVEQEAAAAAAKADTLTSVIGDSEIKVDEIAYEKLIGSGNFGEVYRGVCQRKQVAIKVINCNLSPEKLAEVRQEIKIDLSLRHPNVVLTMGACTTVPGKLIIVSELMRTDLEKLILHSDVQLPLLTRMKMSRDAAAGVLWLHTRSPPIIHRDIKMENFLVDESYTVKVCDFGLSQIKDKPFLVDERNHARGTPLWMPPEVLSGKPFTEKADVYSFGLLLWSMLTTEPHFKEIMTHNQLYRAVLGGVRPPIPEDTNKRLAALISACWNGDPAVRPSFQKVVDELDTVIMELAVPLHGAREWWLSSFKMAQRVQWFTFINKYCHDFKIVAEFIKVEDVLISRAEDCMAVSVDIRAFEALITDKTTGEVAAEKFGDAVSWLGELPAYGRRIMRIASKMLRKEYFFGDVSKEESEKLLSQKPPGTFLVRFSTSNLGGYTISRVTHTGAISHRRITHYAGALEYSFGNEKANSLPDIIEKIRPQQHLDSPCPGWPFAYLFAAPSATNGYTDNDGYDDGNDDDMENE